MRFAPLSFPLLLTTCGGTATWNVTTWGEEYIEDEIPAAEFADGCSATFSKFQVLVDAVELIDGNGDAAAQASSPMVFDVTAAGPHALESLEVPKGTYDTVRYVVGPASGAVRGGNIDDAVAQAFADTGNAYAIAGVLTCGGTAVSFDLAYATKAVYVCEAEDLTFATGGARTTELTMHGDHLFYDGLTNPEAQVRGQAIHDADANDDGVVTHAELAAVSVASLGYQVGPNADVTDLDAFLAGLTQTVGHIDGEGHCDVVPD